MLFRGCKVCSRDLSFVKNPASQQDRWVQSDLQRYVLYHIYNLNKTTSNQNGLWGDSRVREEELWSSHLEIESPSMCEISNISSSMKTFDGECVNRHVSHYKFRMVYFMGQTRIKLKLRPNGLVLGCKLTF